MAYKPGQQSTFTVAAGASFYPNNAAAERNVLSYIAHNTDQMHTHMLVEDYFYDHKNKLIFQCIRSLSSKVQGTKINSADVINIALQKKLLEDMGGAPYIESVIDEYNAKKYSEGGIQMIKDCSIQRKAIDAAEELKREAHGKSGDEIMALLNTIGGKVMKNHSLSQRKTASTAVDNIFAEYEDYQKNGVNHGMKTGIKPMDDFLQGLRPCYFVLGALSSVGKTALLCNVFWNLVKEGKKMIFFSQEMTQEEIIKRILSIETGIGIGKLSSGMMTPVEFRDVQQVMLDVQQVLDEHAEIYDDSLMSIEDVKAKSMAFQRRMGKIDGIFVDYIQVIDVPGIKASDEYIKVSQVSKLLKGIGKDLKCLVFALSQLTPDAANTDPTPSMLRGSKQIMQDADIIFLMSRKEHRSTRKDECDILLGDFCKGRSVGEQKTLLKFSPKLMSFTDVKKYELAAQTAEEVWGDDVVEGKPMTTMQKTVQMVKVGK